MGRKVQEPYTVKGIISDTSHTASKKKKL